MYIWRSIRRNIEKNRSAIIKVDDHNERISSIVNELKHHVLLMIFSKHFAVFSTRYFVNALLLFCQHFAVFYVRRYSCFVVRVGKTNVTY